MECDVAEPRAGAEPGTGVARRLAPPAFLAAGLFCLTPYATPGLALAIGIGLALSVGNPWPAPIKRSTRGVLQVSVVLLGFGMNLSSVFAAARQGFLLAAATILLTFGLGAFLQRALRVKPSTATLLSAGTAICGGSAIAAVGLAITAPEAEISVALGTVFLLNGVALYVFPPLGHWLGMSQVQFGTWSGIAIHDLSSVVGAASAYGQVALQTATAVKLSRTLWIMPVALAAGLLMPRAGGAGRPGARRTVSVPWFVGLFLLASLASTFLPLVHQAAPALQGAARTGMTLALLLIGSGLSAASLRHVGARPLVHGLALWLFISLASLGALHWLGAAAGR
jgi:uncharacterized integral membrane protein (TIGR00698 family)